MDSNGNINRLPPDLVADLNDPKKIEALKQMLESGQMPIPAEELPRVRKMNNKARRKWIAKQRKKTRSKTS